MNFLFLISNGLSRTQKEEGQGKEAGTEILDGESTRIVFGTWYFPNLLKGVSELDTSNQNQHL